MAHISSTRAYESKSWNRGSIFFTLKHDLPFWWNPLPKGYALSLSVKIGSDLIGRWFLILRTVNSTKTPSRGNELIGFKLCYCNVNDRSFHLFLKFILPWKVIDEFGTSSFVPPSLLAHCSRATYIVIIVNPVVFGVLA